MSDLVVSKQSGKEFWEVPNGANTRYGPHGYFRYIGKFPPQIARKLIRDYSSKANCTILDPMCGGGTVLTEGVLSKRRRIIGYDVNKVALVVSNAVTTPLDSKKLHKQGEELMERFYELVGYEGDLFTKRNKPKNLDKIKLFGNEKFFSPTAHAHLSCLFSLINNILDNHQRNFFLTCFFGILRRTSFCNVKKMNIELDESKKKVWPVDEIFNKDMKRNIKLNEDFCQDLGRKVTDVVVRKRDAREFDKEDSNIDLVIIHPPYMSNTAFSESTQLQLAFMDIDHKKVWKSELRHRGSYLHEPNGVRKYLVGWCNIIRQAAYALRKGGYIAIVIGDGQVDTVRIPLGVITEEYLKDTGFKIVKKAEHILNNNTGRTLNRRMKTQHIVIGRKK